MRMRRIGAVAAVAAVVLVGCGESNPNASSSDTGADSGSDAATQEAVKLMDDGDIIDETGEKAVTVDAVDNNFKPEYIEVTKGTKVKFVNKGGNKHNVSPVAEGEFKPIDTDEFDPGEDGTITFDEAGDFPYYCTLHGTKTKGMIGGIKVVDG